MNNTEKIEAGIDHILAGEDALCPLQASWMP
jgi:hypothetical protein